LKVKTAISIIVFVTAILIIGGYFLFFNKSEPVKYTGPIEKITVGSVGEYSIFNLVAKEKGYFLENGLDVEINEYESGPPGLDDLLLGKVDFAIAGEFPGVVYMFNNKNLRILAMISKQKVSQIVARKDKGINKPRDLSGKKIGLTKNTVNEYFLSHFLLFNNLSIADVTTTNLSPKEMIDQLKRGQIDAVSAYEPTPYNIQKILGDNAITWSAQGYQDTYTLLYSTDEFIKNHPQIVERYIKSLLQAEQYTEDNNTEIKDFTAKVFHYDSDYINTSWPRITFKLSLDQELILILENVTRWAIENRMTIKTKSPNYLDYIYFDALNALKPEAVNIIR
jgi:NitT/TauT family transport system substrate-binding protein